MALQGASGRFITGFGSAYMAPITVLAASIAAGRQVRGEDGLLKALRYAGEAAYKAAGLAVSGEARYFRRLWNSPNGRGELAAYAAGFGLGLFTHMATPIALYRGVRDLRRGRKLHGLMNLGFGVMGAWYAVSGAWQLSQHVSSLGIDALLRQPRL